MALNFETKPFPSRVSLLRAAGVHTVPWSSAQEAPGWAWGAHRGIIKGHVPWKPEDLSYVVTSRGQLCRRHSPTLDSASWTRHAGRPHPRPAPGATFAACASLPVNLGRRAPLGSDGAAEAPPALRPGSYQDRDRLWPGGFGTRGPEEGEGPGQLERLNP